MNRFVDWLFHIFFAVIMSLATITLTLCVGISVFSIYSHAYMQDDPRWCEWCDGILLFQMPKPYKGLKLCREHTAKAIILGENGRLTSSIDR